MYPPTMKEDKVNKSESDSDFQGEDDDAGSQASKEEEDDDAGSQISEEEVTKKKRKRGIIYLSTIPRGMNVATIREIFNGYGKVGRSFLQPGKSKATANNVQKSARYYTEGWIEFESKRVAKQLAFMLNNTLIGGRKKSKYYEQTWNIKYLPRFKWAHLSERLAYEKATRQQRMRVEIAQAKTESNHFANNLDISEKLRKRKKDGVEKGKEVDSLVLPRQRKSVAGKGTDTDDLKKLKKEKKKKDVRGQFLTNLFGQT